MRRIIGIVLAGGFVLAGAAWAQTPPAPVRRTELERLSESCSGFSFGKIMGCGESLFTEHPVHIAVGSLAPQNGFGSGGAFVWNWTPKNWRDSLNADAVATPNGSWRASVFLTAVWIRRPHISVTNAASGKKSNVYIQEQPVFHVYTETTSLNKLTYFGLGPNTTDTARSYFGMRETIAGADVIWPAFRRLNMSLLGEANTRLVDLRGSQGQSSPSIEQIYTPVTAPGLANQPAYAQFGEGIRIRPSLAHDYVNLNYSVNLKEFVSSSSSSPSFRRLNLDFQHQFLLYQTTRSIAPREGNGPDECSEDPSATARQCPPITLPKGSSRNLEGSISLGLSITESFSGGSTIPFYFQPTLGGSDINGSPSLPSYQDYRFRGPNTILFHASFEHSVYSRWPIGVVAMIDEGKIAMTHGDVDFSHLRHSYAAGLTLHAGGFPLVYLLFSWGGREGMHTIGRMDTSLLGGGVRPSYY